MSETPTRSKTLQKEKLVQSQLQKSRTDTKLEGQLQLKDHRDDYQSI
mgnify:CR=1 FL=1